MASCSARPTPTTAACAAPSRAPLDAPEPVDHHGQWPAGGNPGIELAQGAGFALARTREKFGDAFWGFWMLGGMSGGGMGFIVAPQRKAEAQARALAATALGGFGIDQMDQMARLGDSSALIALALDGFQPDESGGTVSLRSDGRVRLDYEIPAAIWEALREGSKALARIQLAAGAEVVRSFHEDPVVMRSEADVALLDRAPWQPLRVAVFSAHPMGGCAMGKDPARSVVSPSLRHHALENLWVVDGSVLPTSLGVNPQLTIFAIAHWAADGIAAIVQDYICKVSFVVKHADRVVGQIHIRTTNFFVGIEAGTCRNQSSNNHVLLQAS